jgi:flagellar P-ring protein precursor FlgI
MGMILARYARLVFLMAVSLLPAGCAHWFAGPVQPASVRPAGTMENLASYTAMHSSAALEGTVGSVTYLEGARMMRVRGYGLVVGLNGNGSRNSVPSVREYLARELRRSRLANPHVERRLSPEELIDSPDTSVVEVFGEIGGGLLAGQTFDITVSASSFDPDTQSLAGGYLLTCDLKIYREVSPQEIIEGRTLAKARGPIFMNPFTQRDGSSASGSNPREGIVIGGGMTLDARQLSLVSVMESYATVRQVETAINRVFSGDPKAAVAVSPTNIELHMPPEYRGRERRFIELVTHLSLASTQAAREARGQQLLAELTRPDAPLEDVALSLEGIGPTVLPMIKDYYTHSRRDVNYYAARTGVRLGDELGLEVLIRHAQDERSPYQSTAIRELGESRMPVRASFALKELLANSDPRIRISAYEALRRVDSDLLQSRVVGHEPENFLLDIVPSDGPAMIYARRTGIRRIALIGGDRLVLRPPLLYSEPGKPIILSAQHDDRLVSIIKKDQNGRIIMGPTRVGFSVPLLTHFLGHDPKKGLSGQLLGVGIEYSVVLDVLFKLCEKGAINAEFRWEEPSVEDILGPLKPMGRPESEL